jgi:3'-phosphoadenosine 5'-phosphosulfate sulfotransferase (PAPS reductase)/FAD synthetase
MKWYPIRHWSADDVFAYLRKNGVTPNPLYRLGMKRVGCMPCIDCGKNEMRQIARRFPEHIDKIAEWESIVAAVSKRGLATFFAGDTDPLDGDDPDKKDGYADIRRVVEWSRTTRGGRQYGLDAWAEKAEPAGCSSLYGLCE